MKYHPVFLRFRWSSCLLVSVQIGKVQFHSQSLHCAILQLVPEQPRHEERNALEQQDERDPLVIRVVDGLALLLLRRVGPDARVAVSLRLRLIRGRDGECLF